MVPLVCFLPVWKFSEQRSIEILRVVQKQEKDENSIRAQVEELRKEMQEVGRKNCIQPEAEILRLEIEAKISLLLAILLDYPKSIEGAAKRYGKMASLLETLEGTSYSIEKALSFRNFCKEWYQNPPS